jgi:hypothetical protein
MGCLIKHHLPKIIHVEVGIHWKDGETIATQPVCLWNCSLYALLASVLITEDEDDTFL